LNFASIGLPAAILKGVRAAGLTEATALQSKAIPVVLAGNDLLGSAQAGSGKTAAYGLPILSRLLDSSSRLRAVVMVPTREMAQYVETRMRDFARFTDIRIGVVFTGAPLAAQERSLREQGVDLLVSTPGRLLELHARGVLNFADVEILVLDEADRMVSLGLAPDLRKLLKLLPETRQTVMFSANMPPELNRLAKEALIEPVRVDLGLPTSKPTTGITQAVYPVPGALKSDLLDEMLSRAEVRSTVVVSRSRTATEKLAKLLQRRGYAVAALDDHPSQGERDQALEDLKRGRVQILVASNTSARSLDMSGIAHVVNYDVPLTPEDYVHRLGRAGRPDAVGDAFTLMSPEEQKEVEAVERFLGRAIPRVLLPDFDYDMTPGEPRHSAFFEENGGRAPGGARGGVSLAATQIAALPRSSGSDAARGTAAPARGPASPATREAVRSNGARPAKRPPVRSAPPRPSRPAARVASAGARRAAPARARGHRR
jgi:ATP-dependent RNA helicase RhlE